MDKTTTKRPKKVRKGRAPNRRSTDSRVRAGVSGTRSDRRDAKYGEGYDAFRTGLDYEAVKMMLWSGSEDSKDWRYKRRGTVLGMWFQLKQQLFNQYLDARE